MEKRGQCIFSDYSDSLLNTLNLPLHWTVVAIQILSAPHFSRSPNWLRIQAGFLRISSTATTTTASLLIS